MKPIEISHEAADLLEMYGHLLRKIHLVNEVSPNPDLAKAYDIMKKHRQKMIRLLDRMYKYVCDNEEVEYDNEAT